MLISVSKGLCVCARAFAHVYVCDGPEDNFSVTLEAPSTLLKQVLTLAGSWSSSLGWLAGTKPQGPPVSHSPHTTLFFFFFA